MLKRRLSKKKKGSKNRGKARVRVARMHRKIRRQRDDFLHKTSHGLAEKYGTIVFEKLNVAGMVKNHSLAKHITDAAWSRLITFTTYKASRAGGCVEEVDPRRTSQECSGCGEIVPKTLADRIHCCPHCGLVMDRDENAAINILGRNAVGTTGSYASGHDVRPKVSAKAVTVGSRGRKRNPQGLSRR